MRASGEQVEKRGCYPLVHIREETACRGHSRPRFIGGFYMGMMECVISYRLILYPLMDLRVCSGSLSVGSCNYLGCGWEASVSWAVICFFRH